MLKDIHFTAELSHYYSTISSVPVWILGLKLVQFPSPIVRISVIVFRRSGLVSWWIGGSLAVILPPVSKSKKARQQNKALYWALQHKTKSQGGFEETCEKGVQN